MLRTQPGFTLDDSLPRIRVLVRKRPLNAKERGRRDEDVVVVQSPSLTVHEPRTKVDLTRYTECHSFTFDEVLDEDATNDEVYASAVEPLIGAVFQRGKATCFAYGQTGARICVGLCAHESIHG
jgi:kinesin family member 2/24